MDTEETKTEEEKVEPTTTEETTEEVEPSKPPEVPEPEARFQEPEPSKTAKPEPDELPDEDEDVVDEDDRKIIATQVAKELERRGIGKADPRLQEIKDTIDVDNYIAANPDYGKYRQSMLTYIKHSAYSNIPVKNIAAIVSANDAQMIGARKEREAQAQVASTKGGGTTVRPTEGAVKDWTKATPEEVAAKTAEVLGRNL